MLPSALNSFYVFGWMDFAEGANWNISSNQKSPTANPSGLEWGAFISELVLEFNPDAPDTPTPPNPVAPLTNYSSYIPAVKR